MKLAECLLQDRPIRRELFAKWCKPEIVKSNISPFAALPTVGKYGSFHLLASRYSVEKSGAYRRLLEYCAPIQSPTIIREVFVRPFSVTVL